jgi:hypothetical protein
MSAITVAVSATIEAPANQVYSILADYRNHHPHILPPAYFTELTVEEGGQGEGTVFRATLRMLGQEQSFRMRVTEPELGRVLAENDLATDLVTRFIVEPHGSDQANVTIATTFQRRAGVRGWLEGLLTPGLLRRAYRVELKQLNEYAQQYKAGQNTAK